MIPSAPPKSSNVEGFTSCGENNESKHDRLKN